MATMPETLRFTEEQEKVLAEIRANAKAKFVKFKKVERLKGRKYFPEQPYEFSWAYEQHFRRQCDNGKMYWELLQYVTGSRWHEVRQLDGCH